MHWYNDGVHGDPDDHEGDKVQKVTRGSIYSKVFKILHRTYRIVQAACERAEKKYAVVHGHMRDHNDLILTPTPPRQHHHTHPPTRPTHTTVIVAIINNVNI